MLCPMKPKAVLFDFYNTLLDIQTDEDDPEVWDGLARFLRYQGLRTDAGALHAMFAAAAHRAQAASGEPYPEINMVDIFRSVLRSLGHADPEHFGGQITQLFRILSIRRFKTFPDTLSALRRLRGSFKLGLVSDAQRAFLDPEMEQIGVLEFFDTRIISSDYGFRKPDARLFAMALDRLGVSAGEALFIGDDPFRDVYGAQSAGMPGLLLKRHATQNDSGSWYRPDMTFRTLDELLSWLVN